MSKFINSTEAITSPLLLWQDKPTQVSIEDTYDIKVWPATNIFNDGPIAFSIPPQPNGMLYSVNVVTKFKINIPDSTGTTTKNDLSIINNIGNAMWETVEIKLDDRVDLMQSMRNSYAYQTYFNTCLNTDSSHQDYLFANQLFRMDDALDKADAEKITMIVERDLYQDEIARNLHTSNLFEFKFIGSVGRMAVNKIVVGADAAASKVIDYVAKNKGALARALRINKGQSVTTTVALQCPLFTTGKCLPTNMKIRILLSRNSDRFLLMTSDNSNCKVVIEDVYLDVTYYRPRDVVLNMIEEQLRVKPAPYFISKPEIILKPITGGNRIIRVTDVFHEKLPSYAFFCLQKSADFEGKFSTNPYAFVPFGKFQIHVNGVAHFVDPLEINYEAEDGKKIYRENAPFLRKLYATVGRDMKGDCLINSNNFQLNFMVGTSFTADRSSTTDSYLNLQETANTYVEIDMGYDADIPDDMVLIVYALHDRQIQIDANRSIRIIE